MGSGVYWSWSETVRRLYQSLRHFRSKVSYNVIWLYTFAQCFSVVWLCPLLNFSVIYVWFSLTQRFNFVWPCPQLDLVIYVWCSLVRYCLDVLSTKQYHCCLVVPSTKMTHCCHVCTLPWNVYSCLGVHFT